MPTLQHQSTLPALEATLELYATQSYPKVVHARQWVTVEDVELDGGAAGGLGQPKVQVLVLARLKKQNAGAALYQTVSTGNESDSTGHGSDSTGNGSDSTTRKEMTQKAQLHKIDSREHREMNQREHDVEGHDSGRTRQARK
jgi:hypothetical protein